MSLLFVWNKISAYFIHRPLTFSSDRFSASLRYFLFSEFLSENNLSLSVHFAFEVNRCRIWIPKGFEFPVIHLTRPDCCGYRSVIGRVKRHHKFCTTFRAAAVGLKASSRCHVTRYNCDPANDPLENKLPSSIYRLLGLERGRRREGMEQLLRISFVNSLSNTSTTREKRETTRPPSAM